jgi:signal transduction histidine kinase
LELLLNNHFGNLSTAQREILAEILNSSKYMFSMVDSLLAKYKYENCELSLKKEEIDLNQIILNCCNELKIIADEQNQKIVTNLQPGCLIAEIDPVEFKRVVINIILNSIKCSPNNSLINVSTYKQDSEIKIKIADNGIGISKEKLPHIFDKYVSYTDKFRPVGTGLGLYISKKLIELHNGKICVDSEEGRGSTFTVSVPFKASAASV